MINARRYDTGYLGQKRMWEYGFLKSFNREIVTVFLCLSIAALIVWYCLFGKVSQEPGGTLVKQAEEVML